MTPGSGSPDGSVPVSPDYLAAPRRGAGVRRLNRVPLLVVGLIVALAVIGISYTFFQRQAAIRAKAAEGPQPPVRTAAVAPVLPPRGDYVAVPVEPAPPVPPVPTDQPAVPPVAPPPYPGAPPAVPADPAYDNRRQLVQAAEQKRLADLQTALGADGAVQGFGNRGSAGTPASSGSGAGPVGAPGAADQIRQYLATVGANGAGGPGSLVGLGGGDPAGTPPGASAGFAPGGGGAGGQPADGGMTASNQQDRKSAFLVGPAEGSTYLNAQRRAPVAPTQEVKAGTIIPGVMISGLNSDLPGQVLGQVRENVYDSATGTQLLIPAGARLVGTYDSGVTLGQRRALLAWTRIIYPDSSSISLGRMPGTDVEGYAGFADRVDNHYLRVFGNAILVSLFSAGVQLSQPQASSGANYNNQQIVAAALGQQLGQLGIQIANRNLNIQPTLEIRPGYVFNVMVTRDIVLPTWEGHPLATAAG